MRSNQLRFGFVVRGVGVAIVALATVILLILFVPPPRPIVNLLVERYELLALSRDKTGAQFVAETWATIALAGELAERVPDGPMPEAERIGRTLVALKPLFISQTELPHSPASTTSLLSGVGWCDQVNAAGAQILARRYPIAETVAIPATTTSAGHTIGRVWAGRWLYFDLWADDLVVMDDKRVLFHRAGKTTMTPAEAKAIAALYARRNEAVALYRFRPTFGGQLWQYYSNLRDHGSFREPGATEVVAADIALNGASPYSAPPPRTTDRNYVFARLRQIDGEANAFRDVQAEGVFGEAARVFARR